MSKRSNRGPKKANFSHPEAQRWHTTSRARKRLSMSFTHEDIRNITELIQTGQSVYVGEESLSVSFHEVTYRGKRIHVVYDRNSHQPKTVWPAGDKR